MKFYPRFVITLFAVLSLSPLSRAGESAYVPGEILFMTKSDAAPENIATVRAHLRSRRGASVSKVFRNAGHPRRARRMALGVQLPPLHRIHKLKLDPSENFAAALAELRRDPEIVFAEPNYIRRASLVPDDTYYSTSGEWGQTYRDLWGLQKINAQSAWDSATGSGIIVAVIDSGVDYNHADINDNIWINAAENGGTATVDDDDNNYVDDIRGWDFTTCTEFVDPPSGPNDCVGPSKPKDNNPIDDHGHGTHVAGTIAAEGNNATGVVGVAFGAKIMALKALDSYGSGVDSEIAEAIEYAAHNGAHVINMSLGGPGSSSTLLAAVQYAHGLGVVIVAAAGNFSMDAATFVPASYDEVIAVSSTDINDDRSGFSNFGSVIAVGAPGGGDTTAFNTTTTYNNILSLLSSVNNLGSIGSITVDTNYLRIVGTSMASPHVAGLAALILEDHPVPTLSPDQVKWIIELSADDILPAGFDEDTGFGRINAIAALQLADTPPTEAPLAPVFASVADQDVEPNANLTFSVSATDPNGDTITYDTGTLPTGATFNASTQTFDWTPALGLSGNYFVVFTASDGIFTTGQTVKITVGTGTTPPSSSGGGCATTGAGPLLLLALLSLRRRRFW